jgi:hypothetical protein
MDTHAVRLRFGAGGCRLMVEGADFLAVWRRRGSMMTRDNGRDHNRRGNDEYLSTLKAEEMNEKSRVATS